jgi:hypothetical protein
VANQVRTSSATGDNNEDLRALLNAGYKAHGDGHGHRVCWGTKSMNVTPALTIHMRKRHDEVVEEFIEEEVGQEAASVRADLEAWAGRRPETAQKACRRFVVCWDATEVGCRAQPGEEIASAG